MGIKSSLHALVATIRPSGRWTLSRMRRRSGKTAEPRFRSEAPVSRSICLLLSAFALGLMGAALTRPAQVRAEERRELKTAADMTVTVAQAKRMCFSDVVQLSGVLVPRREILVRPDREGLQISQVLVEPGDSVVSGQILARLTPPDGQSGGGQGAAIQAPAPGVISAKFAVIGALASARAEPLFRIAAQGEMELQAEVPARYLGTLTIDQPATFQILGIGELQGKIRLISTAINPITQLGEVRLFVGNDPRLRVGVFGRATVNIGQRCNAAIPLSALLYGPDGAVVQTVRDNRIETRRVSVGFLASGEAEIREGLADGDTVVARAGAFLREGDRVRPVQASEPARRQ